MPDQKNMEALDDEVLEGAAGGGRFLQYDTEGVNKYSWFVSLMMDLFPDNREKEKINKEGQEKQSQQFAIGNGNANIGR